MELRTGGFGCRSRGSNRAPNSQSSHGQPAKQVQTSARWATPGYAADTQPNLHIRAGRRAAASVLSAAVLLCLSLPASTSAVIVRELARGSASFSGQQCGSTDVATLRLPHDAQRPRARTPKPGTGLKTADSASFLTVARITAARSERADGSRRFGFTATGSDDVCLQPSAYPTGWTTSRVPLAVAYQRRVRVYFAGADGRRRSRPRILYFGAAQRIFDTRWRSWNGSTSRGRGTFPFNDCVPFCAEGTVTNYPVTVQLSRPRRCGVRYQYLTLRYRFLAGPYRGRGSRTSFDYLCP
jgi:hypothetical protein